MFVLIFMLIVISSTNGKSLKSINNQKIDPLSPELIDYVNSLNTTWRAGENVFNVVNLKRLAGTIKESREMFKSKTNQINRKTVSISLPDHFDAREAWPYCTSIAAIRDQGGCSTCWAVNTVSVMSDRLCIKSNGTINVQLSAEEVISCCTNCGLGCKGGGKAYYAFQFWMQFGIVTGGSSQGEGCYPYEIGYCPKDDNGTLTCEIEIPVCKSECGSWYNKSFADDRFYGVNSYYLDGDEQIMLDIITNGPVSCRMNIFNDFYNYQSGVYQHTVEDADGCHTVKLIGWGSDQGVDYWLAANSWGSYWGDKGFFKIKKGDSDIGSDALTGLPKLW